MTEVRSPTRRRNGVLAAGVAVAAAVCVALAMFAWPKASAEPSPNANISATSYVVVYEAEAADARGLRSASYTIQTPSGTAQGNIDLPLKNRDGGTGLTIPGFHAGDFVYLSVQNRDAAGSVTCRITVTSTTGSVTASRVISENTSTGGYVIASCDGHVPANGQSGS